MKIFSKLSGLFKLTKSNIISLALIASIAMIATAGGSVAYFSDHKEMTNVFTAGNVYISLTEAAVKSDGAGNLIEDTESPRVEGVAIDSTTGVQHNYGVLFPGKVMHKDPTITNTGEESAWVAARIIISDGSGDINKLFGYENSELIDIESMLTGALLDEETHVGVWMNFENASYNDHYVMVQVADVAAGVYEFFFFINTALQKDESVVIFDTMTIDSEFSNSDMQELVNLEITVQAFAVQTFGFDSCYGAMSRAFPEYFASVISANAE